MTTATRPTLERLLVCPEPPADLVALLARHRLTLTYDPHPPVPPHTPWWFAPWRIDGFTQPCWFSGLDSLRTWAEKALT